MARFAGMVLLGTMAAGTVPLSPAHGSEAPVTQGSLIYELKLERAGSRSQGLRGHLYGDDGKELPPRLDLQAVAAPFGAFRYEGCSHLWSDCGYLRVETRPPRQLRDPYADGPTVFRIMILSVNSASVFQGELASSNVPVSETAATADSPLGLFRRCVRFGTLAWTGWIPDSWLDKAGRARCAGAEPLPEPNLAGTKWQTVPDTPFTPLYGGMPGLAFSEDRAVLFLGCNSAEGKWSSPTNGMLRIVLGGKTKMNCPATVDDDVLFAAFDGPVRYEVEDGFLTLSTGSGDLLATMREVGECPHEQRPGDPPC